MWLILYVCALDIYLSYSFNQIPLLRQIGQIHGN